MRSPRVFKTAADLLTSGSRSLLPVWAGATLLEAIFFLSLPGDLIGWLLRPTMTDGIESLANVSLPRVLLAVAGVWFVDFLRTGLYLPARRIVLDGETFSPRSTALCAASRFVSIMLVRQTIGAFVLLGAMACMLVGARLTVFPEALAAFTLAPAVYLAAAHGSSVTGSILRSIGWSRRHLLWIFGAQGLLFCMWAIFWEVLQANFLAFQTVPLIFGAGAASAFISLRFVEWVVLSSTFLAIDAAEGAS